MRDQRPIEAPVCETPTIRRETPQRRRRRRRPWFGAAAVAAAVLVAVAVIVIILGTGSAHPVEPPTHPVVPPPRPVVQPPRPAVQPPRPVVTPPPSRPASSGALAALSSYWQAIGRHDFAAAYAMLAPGTVPQTQAQWVGIEQQTGVQSARFTGQTTSSTDTEATVQVSSLVTQDMRYGCRNWIGTYRMINLAGHWFIGRADITPANC